MVKSWKTTAIGIIALLGLGYNIYTNGGISVSDFLLLITSIGFLLTKDSDVTHSGALVTGIRKMDRTDIGGDGPSESERD